MRPSGSLMSWRKADNTAASRRVTPSPSSSNCFANTKHSAAASGAVISPMRLTVSAHDWPRLGAPFRLPLTPFGQGLRFSILPFFPLFLPLLSVDLVLPFLLFTCRSLKYQLLHAVTHEPARYARRVQQGKHLLKIVVLIANLAGVRFR